MSRPLVDTDGSGLTLEPHEAGIQNRDEAVPSLKQSRSSFPSVEKLFGQSGYADGTVANATSIAVEVVRRKPDQVGFAAQPRRWVVVGFFAWIKQSRPLAKDFEASIALAKAFLYALPSCYSSAASVARHES